MGLQHMQFSKKIIFLLCDEAWRIYLFARVALASSLYDAY